MESLTLTVAETKPTNAKYDIAGIHETWLPAGQEAIEINLLGANGDVKTVRYGPTGLIGPDGAVVPGTPTGSTLLRLQNKMNFSTNSRQKRIFQQLTTDGVFAGAITGTPD